MKNNIEREFKSALTKDEYLYLINKYNLKDKIYIQTNYYFDTPNNDLKQKKDTLRIRIKDINNHLTLKTNYNGDQLEKTLVIDSSKAKDMIDNGFDAKIVGVDAFVKVVAKLETKRCRFNYQCGELFIDQNNYYGITDYEVEFEINPDIKKEDGQKVFLEFLKDNNIVFKKQISKSQRAFKKGTN